MMQRLEVEAGLAAERALLEQVHRGEREAGLLLWRPLDRALVMPARMSRLPGFETARAGCETLDWPVSLRDTGGEPVPQSPGVLNIALAYAAPTGESELTRIETAYLRLCRPLCDWLAGQGLEPGIGEVPGAFCDGRYNVRLGARKLVGTAQRWRRRSQDGRNVVLVHGAMLVENEREAMVALVNAFYVGCGLADRCEAASHVGLAEHLERPWNAVPTLSSAVRRALTEDGIPLPDA
ncbi:lipoate--protein ligase family protein [Metapseudomonas otitidis]|uniref:lipoate--protein ligase family protein n=1 Tax=Metapseudomonas otitidis TaxID=319939 RepID=UPI001F0FD31D|nr:lipoate--protein ligase family protein [Pseudomonas otitidis]